MTRPVDLLQLRGVVRSFGAAGAPALKDVNLDVAAGDFIAIVGPSGAGKSTLLNVLGLLDRPTSGSYLIRGQDVNDMSERERNRIRSTDFGFVFQASHALGDESALSNAGLGLRIQRTPLTSRATRASEALRRLGLGAREQTRAKLLSGGERQRLAISRAIATRPAIVLADEPTGNLDSENSGIVMEHLRQLNLDGTTVIIITHDEEIASQAPRRVRIRDGVLVEETEPRSITAGDPPAPDGKRRAKKTKRSHGDDLMDALSSLSSRMFRTILLILAFAIGIGGLVAAAGLSSTTAGQISERLTAAALDEVVVDVPDGMKMLASEGNELATWDKKVQSLPHVKSAGYLATLTPAQSQVTRGGPFVAEPDTAISLGTASSSYLELAGVSVHPANALGAVTSDQGTDLAIVSAGAANALDLPFSAHGVPSPGARLWVNGRAVAVVGTFEVSDRSAQLLNSVLVSPRSMRGLDEARVQLVTRTELGFPVPVAKAIPLALAPENPGSIATQTVADLRDLRVGVANDLGVFVGLLSTVLIILAAISAATAMYLTVQARAAEIALRRAIGASRGLIGRMFVIEGLLLGFAGGAVGAAVGTAAVLLISAAQGWTAILPAHLVLLGIGTGVATGVVSAVYPAWVASRQDPALAIRG